jgi:hypothetical protein
MNGHRKCGMYILFSCKRNGILSFVTWHAQWHNSIHQGPQMFLTQKQLHRKEEDKKGSSRKNPLTVWLRI